MSKGKRKMVTTVLGSSRFRELVSHKEKKEMVTIWDFIVLRGNKAKIGNR